MKINLRALAAADIDATMAYYRAEAGADVALDFVDSLEAAISHITAFPLTGSLQFGYELDIPELRCWKLNKFPYLIFYLPGAEEIDVWRLLHASRDIPSYLSSEQD